MDSIAYNFYSLRYQNKLPGDLSPDFIVDEFSTFIVPEPSSLFLLTLAGIPAIRRQFHRA